MASEVTRFEKCRLDQLVAASNRVINQARILAVMPVTTSKEEWVQMMVGLKRAVDTFDRLNKPLAADSAPVDIAKFEKPVAGCECGPCRANRGC